MVIFAELYIILHGHAVSNNRLADFCRPLFPINLSRTGFQLYEIDDLSKNAAWFHLAKKVFWLESCIEFIIPLLYLIVIMPAKLENQTNDLSFAILILKWRSESSSLRFFSDDVHLRIFFLISSNEIYQILRSNLWISEDVWKESVNRLGFFLTNLKHCVACLQETD